MNRILTLGMYYHQLEFPMIIPNGDLRCSSIARAADTSFGSFGAKRCVFFSSERGGLTGSVAGLTADVFCFRGFVALVLDRNEFEILAWEEERPTVGAIVSRRRGMTESLRIRGVDGIGIVVTCRVLWRCSITSEC